MSLPEPNIHNLSRTLSPALRDSLAGTRGLRLQLKKLHSKATAETRALVKEVHEKHPELRVFEMAILVGVSAERVRQIVVAEGLRPATRYPT